MKYIKRTLALLLAVVLVLALSISAFAVDTNGSIKVDNAVVNKTYTLYRIFDLDSHNTDYSAINYKVSAKWANFFVTGAAGLNYVTIDDMGYVTWKDGANAADFAAAAIAYATAMVLLTMASRRPQAALSNLQTCRLATIWFSPIWARCARWIPPCRT